MISTSPQSETSSNRKVLSGVVVSNKMKDTVVVKVNRYFKHPKYQKYIMKSKRYAADDPGNTQAVGAKVLIEECRPISKTKRFRIVSSA
jgi:small subunit ribosomal protein S17